MTETALVVCCSFEQDVMHRSSGSLLPGFRAKLMDPEGKEITERDRPGELLVQSPSIVLGYLNNEAATSETFIYDEGGRWLRTGDEVLITVSPAGSEHLVIVDRIKELIKVKGHQVAPAELEAHILTHPAVADCAIIQTPDERAGEVPKAFVVRALEWKGKPEKEVAEAVFKHVADAKPSYKWIKGGVEFVDEIPKSPTGKILRRLLRDRERKKRRKERTKL
jgi:acyl-CoA synthetase (AMP-forming)/AMP-acid ligase II